MPGNERRTKLHRPVNEEIDYVLGPEDAEITLVEYGSYACPSCRAANEIIAALRDEFGDRLRYVFRHRPIPDSDIARRAAELVERASNPEQFWATHVELMTRSTQLTEEDLRVVAAKLDKGPNGAESTRTIEQAQARVEGDLKGASNSGVNEICCRCKASTDNSCSSNRFEETSPLLP